MPTILESLADYKQSFADVQKQTAMRTTVMNSPEYQALKAQMDAMLSAIPDSSEELALDREALVKAMNEEKVLELEGCQVKTRKQREVDVLAVLNAFQGDIDALMSVATVSQKNLEGWIDANPEDKRALRSCIIEKGVKVVDVIPLEA